VVTDFGRAAQQKPCQTSAVKIDLQPTFALAQEGAAHVSHPTLRERQSIERLRDQAELHTALQAFAARPAGERDELMEMWWTSMKPPERQALLDKWPTYVPAEGKQKWLDEALDHLSERDLPWVLTEVWLTFQPPFVQREPERWWQLMDSEARIKAERSWVSHLDSAHYAWVSERLTAKDLSAERPARILAWWNSRDAAERDRLREWWDTVDHAELTAHFIDWWRDQPAAVQLAVRWPDVARRTESERDELMRTAYKQLPDGLWPLVLAWVDWHSLSGAALDQALAQEVPWTWRTVESVRWSLRPLDRMAGFSLAYAFPTLGIFGTVGVFLVKRQRRKQAARDPSAPFIRT
jgi:hypothetical protein